MNREGDPCWELREACENKDLESIKRILSTYPKLLNQVKYVQLENLLSYLPFFVFFLFFFSGFRYI